MSEELRARALQARRVLIDMVEPHDRYGAQALEGGADISIRASHAVRAMLAFAAPPAPQLDREAIARIIDPTAGACFNAKQNGVVSMMTRKGITYDYWANAWSMWGQFNWERALAKADAVIATLSPLSPKQEADHGE